MSDQTEAKSFPTMRECLDGMITANADLYEKILDTLGFAYWFNQLCLLAREGEVKQEVKE